MHNVFIAHIEEDADVALGIAIGLEQAGYSTWTYEIDSKPGLSYLLQTGQAVDDSEAVIVVISPDSLGSKQLTKEVVRAHEAGKEFIPVRRDISHVEYQNRQPEWREAIGAASSISVTTDGVEVVTKRIIDGLKALGIHPKPKATTARIKQMRRILTNLQAHGILEGAAKPTVPTKESEAESIAAEVPHIKTAEKSSRRRSLIKKSAIAAAAIAVITIVVIFLSGGFVRYTLSTAVISGGGTITPAGGTYGDGAEVTLTATPAQGYAFDHWSGDAIGMSNPVTITMDSDKSVTATFIAAFKLTTSISPADGGIISISPDQGVYKAGTEVTLTATAAEGHTFDSWGGDATGRLINTNIIMDADKSVTAHFNELLFEDQFNDNRNDWYVDEENYISNGVYNSLIVEEDPDILATRTNFQWPDDSPGLANFGFEVDVITIKCADSMGRGIVFLCDPAKPNESNRPERYYKFIITGDGAYKLLREIGDELTTIIPWTESSCIKTGTDTNRLRIIYRNGNIELYVNDYRLATVEDEVPDVIGDNGIGLLTHGDDGTHIAFDNVRMWVVTDE
jgi:uncharacterized repeat protein (TIGR02543 family)